MHSSVSEGPLLSTWYIGRSQAQSPAILERLCVGPSGPIGISGSSRAELQQSRPHPGSSLTPKSLSPSETITDAWRSASSPQWYYCWLVLGWRYWWLDTAAVVGMLYGIFVILSGSAEGQHKWWQLRIRPLIPSRCSWCYVNIRAPYILVLYTHLLSEDQMISVVSEDIYNTSDVYKKSTKVYAAIKHASF